MNKVKKQAVFTFFSAPRHLVFDFTPLARRGAKILMKCPGKIIAVFKAALTGDLTDAQIAGIQ